MASLLTSRRFNFWSAKKPIDRPSGDQNGKPAPSVPVSSRPDVDASGRSHSALGALVADARRRDDLLTIWRDRKLGEVSGNTAGK
jgi:hypothetical protein